MPVFVLVSGPFTGGQLWQEVTGPLHAAGAGAHPVSLCLLPEADLDTHVEDVVRVIDSLDAPEVVLVGHDYAIHPVLGAADRRPERVARIVHLDAGIPQDGDLPLALVPDPAVRDLLRADGTPEPVAPPAPGEWLRWGSTEGLSARHLDLLSAMAAPQPPRTLTRPLRLTGAAADRPTSGILCTAGGMTVDHLEAMVQTGPPQLRRLADPRVGFFELATGHWPMLSCPEELAEVLLRAAAGQGRRLTAPEDGGSPFLRPFPLDVPEVRRERHGHLDLHLPGPEPAPGPHPAVLLVHGGPLPPDQAPDPRDRPLFLGYARHLAGLGAVGAVVRHRLHSLADYARSADDVAAAIDLLRADPRVDPERIALWFFSGAGLLAADWLATPPAWLRCVSLSYPVLAPLPGWHAVDSRFRPVEVLRSSAGDAPPLLLTRAGRETPQIEATVREFLTAAADTGTRVEIVDVPNGPHGFETCAPQEEFRAAATRTACSVLAALRA